MTAKEKAEELILKYIRIDNNTEEWFNKYVAKQCALIAVDEVIDNIDVYYFVYRNFTERFIKYWNEVKEEINKL